VVEDLKKIYAFREEGHRSIRNAPSGHKSGKQHGFGSGTLVDHDFLRP
jgi:hypothetical protein